MSEGASISASSTGDKTEIHFEITSGNSVVDSSVIEGTGNASVLGSLASTAERANVNDENNDNDNDNDNDDATVDEQNDNNVDDNDDTTVVTGMNTAAFQRHRASRRNQQQQGEESREINNTTTRRKKKGFSSQAEENAHKIREAFYILTQGVDIMQYKAGGGKRKGEKIRQVLWLEPELLRICVDSRRVTSADVQRSVTSTGLYLRDIAEIRGGSNAYAFRNSTYPPENENFCLSLIGTETTVCIEFPSQFIRDWFLERFHLVLDDVLSVEEQEARSKRNIRTGLTTGLSYEETTAAQQMLALLKRGIQIHHHNHQGNIVRSMIFYDHDTSRMCLRPSDYNFLSFFSRGSLSASLSMDDIAEVRPGSHSYGFVLTNSTDKSLECMSIVGTECSLDLQLANASSRDLFSQRLRLFIKFWELNLSESVEDDDDNNDNNNDNEEEKGRNEDEDVDIEIKGNMTDNIETELDTGFDTHTGTDTDRRGATRLGVMESASGFSASGWESEDVSGSEIMGLGYDCSHSSTNIHTTTNLNSTSLAMGVAANVAAHANNATTTNNNSGNTSAPSLGLGLDAATRERLRNLRLTTSNSIGSNNDSSSVNVDLGSMNQDE